MIDAGKLDKRITIQQPIETQSDLGDLIIVWQDVSTVWARLLSSKGREFYSGGATLGVDDIGLQCRYSTALSAFNQKWRVVYEGKHLNVYSIDFNGRKDLMTIFAKAGSNDG